MKAVISAVVGIVAGAVAGAVPTYIVMNKRVKEKQNEVVEIREMYAERCEKDGNFEKAQKIRETDKSVKQTREDDQKKVEEIAQENGYGAKYSNPEHIAVERPVRKRKDWIEPYIIAPEAFQDREDDGDGWESRTLFYFADGVLTDDQEDKVEDFSSLIGDKENLEHFGDYEEDSIYIRNENRKIDYEILLDQRKWADAIKKRPKTRMMED